MTRFKSLYSSRRLVPINASARAALVRLKELSEGSPLVCHGGMTKDGYWTDWFERPVTAAGINNLKWHDLRHTFASRLRMKGVELATIKELLGHTTLGMVLRYAHLAPGYLKKAVETIVTMPTTHEKAPEEIRVQGKVVVRFHACLLAKP